MISSKINDKDKRSEYLQLTPEGKKLILEANEESQKLSEIYKEIVGEKNFEIALDVLNKIINYHENLHDNKEEYIKD